MKINILFFIIILSGCNPNRTSKDILQHFDSVNRTLEVPLVTDNSTAQQLYEMVLKKTSPRINKDSIQGLQFQMFQFYAYLDNIKTKFMEYCGSETGENLPEAVAEEVEMTEQFFLNDKQVSTLPKVLENVRELLMLHTTSQQLVKRIESFGMDSSNMTTNSRFLEIYFKNMTPVGAITILNSFESRAIALETAILLDYLKY